MSNYKLSELFTLFDNQEITLSKFICSEYNKLTPTDNNITEEDSAFISNLLKHSLNYLMDATTIYDDADKGISIIKKIISNNIYEVVLESERIKISLNKRLASQHNQSKFNPLDNSDIENAPTSIDDTSFTELQNYLTKGDLLRESPNLNDLIDEFESICYLMR